MIVKRRKHNSTSEVLPLEPQPLDLEVPSHWKEQFEENIEYHPNAKPTWEKIKAAGIERGALRLLYAYAIGEGQDLLPERAKRIKRNCKAAIRAADVAQKRSNDPSSAIFRKREKDRMREYLEDLWLAPDEEVETLGDVLRHHNLPIEQAGRAAVRAFGKDGVASNRMYYLFLLQGYADDRAGFWLGLDRLIVLAACSDDRFHTPSPEALSYYLRTISVEARESILRKALPLLP